MAESGGALPLVERWDGAGWTIQNIYQPPNSSVPTTLDGVSCSSEAACSAVGEYGIAFDGGGAFAKLLGVQWLGLGWSVQPVAMPRDADPMPNLEATHFGGVSCTAVRDCTAVGWYQIQNDNPQFALAEHWDGRAWLPEAPAQPARYYNHLSAVSCVSATACVAVGQYASDAGTLPLVERSIRLAPARVTIGEIRATPLSSRCATETGAHEREVRAITADAVCRQVRLSVIGAIQVGGKLARTARGRLTVTIKATLPRGPITRAARASVAGGRWRISLVLPGVNLDPLPPSYLISVRYPGDDTIGPASAERRIRVEGELAGL